MKKPEYNIYYWRMEDYFFWGWPAETADGTPTGSGYIYIPWYEILFPVDDCVETHNAIYRLKLPHPYKDNQ